MPDVWSVRPCSRLLKRGVGRKRSHPEPWSSSIGSRPTQGTEITFDRVLLVETADGGVVTGQPYVAGASVTAVVEAQAKGKKIRVFKMKRRKHYRRTKGHRTQQTQVRVKSINL